jgi:predicted transporter
MMGSAAFLLVYAAVNLGHLRLVAETKANLAVLWAGIVALLGMFVVLAIYTARTSPSALVAMAILVPACFGAEAVLRRRLRAPDGG